MCADCGQCHPDRHHLFWPKREYRQPIERAFRELPCNTVRMCRKQHTELHLEPPPQKPRIRAMKAAIAAHQAKQCGCYVALAA